jgi:thiamine pyrophosphate-dependent acetolactate synthase large subunit-like protein
MISDTLSRMATVRDATFDVLRRHGLTTLFANPGSTEVPFLTGLPDDLQFVLGLHEATVIGMATGFALGRNEPALALLHTTPGLGNAVSALATARVNRAPLVVLVGQQDRRHLALEPFLAGRLDKLAGEYPVWVDQPVRPQDVPGAIARAAHEAATHRGPAIVIVPMDDWAAPAGEAEPAAADRVLRAAAVGPEIDEIAALLAGASSPAIVAGAGADDAETWAALVELAERLVAPVWQEPFSARTGFPQDHRLFAGHLPADRPRLREKLAPYDVVLVIGGPVLRQYPYMEGRFAPVETRFVVITQDPVEAHRSPAAVALIAQPAAACAQLARALPQREVPPPPPYEPPPTLAPPGDGKPLRAGHVLQALAHRVPRTTVVIEECPSNRPELLARLIVREPLGSISPAMGGLGFAIPAAAGLRMARPDRPVVAVVGDGSSLYAIQALWSAAEYHAGALYVILKNGGYAIMDRLAEQQGGRGPWPTIDVDVAALAEAFGCEARRVSDYETLIATFDEVLPTLGERQEPLLITVTIEPDPEFAP